MVYQRASLTLQPDAIAQGDKETSSRPPSFSKTVKSSFLDATPPIDKRDRGLFLVTTSRLATFLESWLAQKVLHEERCQISNTHYWDWCEC